MLRDRYSFVYRCRKRCRNATGSMAVHAHAKRSPTTTMGLSGRETNSNEKKERRKSSLGISRCDEHVIDSIVHYVLVLALGSAERPQMCSFRIGLDGKRTQTFACNKCHVVYVDEKFIEFQCTDLCTKSKVQGPMASQSRISNPNGSWVRVCVCGCSYARFLVSLVAFK